MPEENKVEFVWYHDSQNSWIGDMVGNPFDTESLEDAKKFFTPEEADAYKDEFALEDDEWSLHEILTRISRY